MSYKTSALWFVICLGIVSLCADATYEGARSITGAYLGHLGASGTIVGWVAGLGELIGYGLRRDVLLSHGAMRVGSGFGFGLHEALDQVGAVAGLLMVAVMLSWSWGYRGGFAILVIPAVLGFLVLLVIQRIYPNPREFEPQVANLETMGLPRLFWLYLGAIALMAAGFADFPLIAFHLQQTGVESTRQIALLYALAMAVDAIAALMFGRWFDRIGLRSLMAAICLSLFLAPLVLSSSFALAVVGMVLWGIGMGAQESIAKAAVAAIVPPQRRGSAFGIFNTGFGLAWFGGSVVMGYLYDLSLPLLIGVSMVLQALAVIGLGWVLRIGSTGSGEKRSGPF